MKTIEQEVLKVVDDIKTSLSLGRDLDEADLTNLFMACLLEEETINEK
jgi:hypothetical protein